MKQDIYRMSLSGLKKFTLYMIFFYYFVDSEYIL